MKIYFDRNHQPEPSKVYLGTPNHKIICALNGIDEDSFSLTSNLNNTYELSFNINRYINIFGKQYETNGYNLLNALMRIYVSNIGWFIMKSPIVRNEGTKEIKSINAESAEIEFYQHDIKGLKINKGTTDSYEMLVDGNVEVIDGVEFALEQIKFYNSDNPDLSFLNILLKVSDVYGWEIGYVDNIPKTYKYYENGELKEKEVLLSDEIGSFEIESQDLYSFLTQNVAQYFNCVFIFDFKNFKINVYRPENIGKDTNINIGFRNLQQSNEITVDDDNNIFTRYTVSGANNLGILYVNFGSNQIENFDYLLNEKYMSADLIKKYKLWQTDVEIYRPEYIENTRLYNKRQNIISELYNRVPLDDCSTDWSTFSDDKLLEAQANYQAQLKGYESYYVDENGDFDLNALDVSSDANDYYQIRDVIIPSIQIEIDNRNLSEGEDPLEYIDTYKTNWNLYGLDELQVKLDEYSNTKRVCESGGYDVPYSDESGHTEDIHNEMYQKYLDAVNQLDSDYVGSCQEAYNQRHQEIDDATIVLNEYDAVRKECVRKVDKKTWSHAVTLPIHFVLDEDGTLTFQDDATLDNNGLLSFNNSNIQLLSNGVLESAVSVESTINFTEDDLECLSRLYVDTTYTNENMFLTSFDDSVSAIDEQLKLLSVAQDDLSIHSQPQYVYTTTLDNFLSKYEYKNYTDNLELGDFIYLGVRDDYVVKLRVISIQYNPMKMDNNLHIKFSNMLKSKSDRYDYAYLLNLSSNINKNSSSSNSNNYLSNGGISLTSGLIQKLVSSGAFSQAVQNEIIASGGSASMSLSELERKLKKIIDLDTGDGYFNYLQAKLISADKIVADSGEFNNLSALVATIDNLLAGNVSAELEHVIHLTAKNVSIDEAVIRQLIAAQITVSMLKAGDISSDSFHIISDDGGMKIVGNTMQFSDAKGNIRIQIGRDANNDFTFVLYDETGSGILIDSTGIKESAISDGLIQTDMIADKAITEDKIDKTNIHEWTDNDGNKVFDVSNMYYGDDKFSVSYTSTVNKVDETYNRVTSLESQIASIELMGEQIFKQIQGVISPETITVTAVCRNGATIGDWYIGEIIVTDTEYVSEDKTSITIPSSYMLDNNIVPIKVTDTTGELYDLHTLYLISDSTGAKGDDAYTVILQNENVSFSVDNSSNIVLSDQSFSSTVQIFQGTTERTDFTIGEINSANGITVTVHDETVILSVKNGDKITENNGFFTVPILIDDLTFYKDITWNLAKQGETGSSGEPSLNIVVGNESQNIPCSNDGLVLENFLIEIPFTGYKGFDRVNCLVSVGLLPDGVTLGSNTASTPESEGLVILNVAKNATLGGSTVLNGKVTLTFTIDGKTMSRYFTWVKTKDGAEGSMTLYELVSSSPILNKNYDDTLSPSVITFNSYYRQSNSTDKISYAGYFIIAESDNGGATYTNKYLSSVEENSVEYTPSSANITSIRCTLCSADDISIEFDTLTVPILSDVDGIKPIITEITTTMSGVQAQVDNVKKSITDKVWQDDIANSINNYDGTITEEIRSRISQSEIDINGIKDTVSDVQSTLIKKADGSTVNELSEKVSTLEQDADGFRQIVEKNYVEKAELNVSSRNLLRNSKTLVFDMYGLFNFDTAFTLKSNGVLMNVRGDAYTNDNSVLCFDKTILDVDENGVLQLN